MKEQMREEFEAAAIKKYPWLTFAKAHDGTYLSTHIIDLYKGFLLSTVPANHIPDVGKMVQPMTFDQFMDDAKRTGLTVDALAKELALRPEFADCLHQHPAQDELSSNPLQLPAQPEQEPIYQLKMGNGSWIDQVRSSYEYNVKHGHETRIVYAKPAT